MTKLLKKKPKSKRKKKLILKKLKCFTIHIKMKHHYSIQLDRWPVLWVIFFKRKKKVSTLLDYEKKKVLKNTCVQERRDLVWEYMLKI